MTDISITARDGTFSGYLAKPATGSGPGLVLIQEIFGINKVMRDLADGFAKQGYMVLCPDLFWRQQPGIQLTDKTQEEWGKAFELYKGFNEALGVEDLIATLNHLRTVPGCSGKVGTVGYCLGGKLAFLMATRSSADANVGYYGVGIEAALGEIGAITKPLLLHIAAKDGFCPPEAQTQIMDSLQSVSFATVYRYPEVDHAFARVGGEHYDAHAAELANARTALFFKEHLS